MSVRHVLGIILAALGTALWFAEVNFNSRHFWTALAQAPADHPASFRGSLVLPPSTHRLSIRQTVNVPAYSSIRLGSGRGKVDLAATLSIHNTSQEIALVLLRADYFDTSGTLIHRYVPEPIAVRPLGSVEAFVPAEDTRGGTGANFVVEWAAEKPIPTPIVEAVMIGVTGTQGYSFVSRGTPTATPR
ncbi:MAG: hypothetical protein K0S06_3159 [Microvirga sp.]|jgi:hypothetical protein|nr:hypothetical protein [Microvirga sp.]